MSGNDDQGGRTPQEWYAAVRVVEYVEADDTVLLRVEASRQSWEDTNQYVEHHPGTTVYGKTFPERRRLGEHVEVSRGELSSRDGRLNSLITHLETRRDADRDFIVARFNGDSGRLPKPGDPVRFSSDEESIRRGERTVREVDDFSVNRGPNEPRFYIVRRSPYLDGLGWAENDFGSRPQAYERANELNAARDRGRTRHQTPDPEGATLDTNSQLRRIAETEKWRSKDLDAIRQSQPPKPPR